DPPDVGGKSIRVLADQLDRLVAIGLVDAGRPRGSNAVRLKENHDAAYGFLLLPALANALNTARTDPLDLLQERRAFVDNRQCPLTENFDDSAREVRSDALDEAGAEIASDALGGL